MLRAHWHGYEIDSSEAAYEAQVPQPEQLGTVVRRLLTSGYFTRSYYLLFEEPLIRLRDFIVAHGDVADKLTAKAAILNYVGTHRQALLEAGVFRFELTEEQKEMMEDYGYDEEFESGSLVKEQYYYSEQEIPLDGIVLYLGCSLVPSSKLEPREAKRAYKLVRDNYARVGLLDELEGMGRGLARDYVQEDINKRQNLSLRVRLNPDATFTVTGRWFDDGQFIFPYYDYLLELAARKAAGPGGAGCALLPAQGGRARLFALLRHLPAGASLRGDGAVRRLPGAGGGSARHGPHNDGPPPRTGGPGDGPLLRHWPLRSGLRRLLLLRPAWFCHRCHRCSLRTVRARGAAGRRGPRLPDSPGRR